MVKQSCFYISFSYHQPVNHSILMIVFEVNLGQPVPLSCLSPLVPEQNFQGLCDTDFYTPDIFLVTQPTVSKALTRPKPVAWPHSFFIHHRALGKRGVAAFMLALRRQYHVDISQGKVATCLRYCSGIFYNRFTANLLVNLNLLVKEFWKSVKIWRSYCREFGVLLFSEHGVHNASFTPPTTTRCNCRVSLWRHRRCEL